MRQEDLCPGSGVVRYERAKGQTIPSSLAVFLGERPVGVKRSRAKCKICGRRLKTSVSWDDFEIVHSVPPHKPKGWWKIGKKRKKRR